MGYFDSHFKRVWKSLDMWDFYYLMFGQRDVDDSDVAAYSTWL